MGQAPSAPTLQDIRVKRGQDITFRWDANCGVYGKWKKASLALHSDSRIIITEPAQFLCFNLTICDATDKDEGEYTLELSNWRGQASGSANVKILDYADPWKEIHYQENNKVKEDLIRFTPTNQKAHRLRFLLHGPVGAGKSSIINSVNSVFQGCMKGDAIVAPPSGKSETTWYKMYEIKDKQGKELSFVFNDIMGQEAKEQVLTATSTDILSALKGHVKDGNVGVLTDKVVSALKDRIKDGYEGVLTGDIISALKGHIKDGYEFNQLAHLSRGLYYNSNPTLDDRVHCLVSVMPAHKIILLTESHGLIKKMNEVRHNAKDLEIPRVVLMTHVDKCCPLVEEDLSKIYSSKKIKIAMETCSNMFGVPMNCIFPVKNYKEENNVDEKVDGLILDALRNIVKIANDYVEKQTEQR